MKIRSKATLTLRAMLARRYGFGRAPTSRLCATCGHRGIACHLAAAPKIAQKNRGPYSGTSVSLAFLMPSAVASITTSSFFIHRI